MIEIQKYFKSLYTIHIIRVIPESDGRSCFPIEKIYSKLDSFYLTKLKSVVSISFSVFWLGVAHSV